MPELHTIAGETVLNFSTKEAFARATGVSTMNDTLFDEIFNEVSHANRKKGELTNFNTFPVLTQNNEIVLPQGGTFSDRELRVALKLGHIVCDPAPNPTHGARINGSSIDVTIGRYFYSAGKDGASGMFNPFSREDTLRYFGVTHPETEYKEMRPWSEVKKGLGKKAQAHFGDVPYLEGIPEDHPMVLLRPNERILAHTQEFIGILPPGTTSMQARSTTGRIGLSACYCAGWGDPGYINRWTMEIHNLNENEYLPVPLGFRIAQVVFSMTGPVGSEYSKTTGNYQSQSSNDLMSIKQTWRPHFVLPKAYNSEVVMPTPVIGLSEELQ